MRKATMNVVIGADMQGYAQQLGVSGSRLRVIHNWTDDIEITPREKGDNALRKAWLLDEKFVVAYSGNLGRAHDFKTLLGAAEKLQAYDHIVFLCIGNGKGYSDLKTCVREKRLNNFRFEPYRSRTELGLSLSVADVHWLSLKPELDGFMLPSKLYGIAAAGRPIIFIGSEESEISLLLKEGNCGFSIRPGNSDELAETISSLAGDPDLLNLLGKNARLMLERGFTKSQALNSWHKTIRAVSRDDRHGQAMPGVARP